VSDEAQKAKVRKLKELEDAPNEQLEYAVKLLGAEKSKFVLEAVIKLLKENPDPSARTNLLKLYQYLEGDPGKRDAGAFLRTPILSILREMLRHEDLPILEKAVVRYEFLPPTFKDHAEGLRSTALLAIDDLDERLASYYAIRLLVDKNTSEFSGEPAVTAVKVLAKQGNLLPLYAHAMQFNFLAEDQQVPEVLAECLGHLASLPANFVAEIFELYNDTESDAIMLGVFDLILRYPKSEIYWDYLQDFLKTTDKVELYRYLCTSIIVSRKSELLNPLIELARAEKDKSKIMLLVEAFGLTFSQNRTNDKLIKELHAKL
jgi:hypothetical protein